MSFPTQSADVLARIAATMQFALGDTDDLAEAAAQLAGRSIETLIVTLEDLSKRLAAAPRDQSAADQASVEVLSSMEGNTVTLEEAVGSGRAALPICCRACREQCGCMSSEVLPPGRTKE
jgi:phage-related minor tail protein